MPLKATVPHYRQSAAKKIFDTAVFGVFAPPAAMSLKNRSGIPAFAAAVAPPNLRLWRPNFLGSRPIPASFSSSSSRIGCSVEHLYF